MFVYCGACNSTFVTADPREGIPLHECSDTVVARPVEERLAQSGYAFAHDAHLGAVRDDG